METNQAELIDTGEKRGGLGRRLMPAQRRAELVSTYQRSGLTQAEFARRGRACSTSAVIAWLMLTDQSTYSL